MMISGKAKAISSVLKLTKFKDNIDFFEPRRSKKIKLPQALYKSNIIETVQIMGGSVHNILPFAESTKQHVIFFHGGGYVLEPSRNNLVMIEKFIGLAKCMISYVEYPLSPESNVNETMEMVFEAYKAQIEKFPDHTFILMGDSAGGGLALALAIHIKMNRIKQPEKLILFSPWLDIALTNPDIALYEDRDFILSSETLREVGKRYAYDVPLEDYRVSPIYGDLNNLGDILVFYGSEEILKPDCEKLISKGGLKNTFVKGIEYEEMQHDWVVLPILEQDLALGDVIDFLLL